MSLLSGGFPDPPSQRTSSDTVFDKDVANAHTVTDALVITRLARVAEVWAAVNNAAREAEAYNLDRKPLVFSVFDRISRSAGFA